MTLVDSNILIDVLTPDTKWEMWSVSMLGRLSSVGELIINEIVYAEFSARYESRAVVDAVVAELGVRLHRMPLDAIYTAGRTFSAYRKRGGTRTSLLPDFFIGAHALTLGIPILTRDVRRYQTYFPDVTLIAP